MWPYTIEENDYLGPFAPQRDAGAGEARRGRPFAAGDLLATLRLWARRRRERYELMTLDERTLTDIAMTPSEASWLARKPFWRE
jgi:uncharacterized protein YjiS (DUF1127 family)